MISPFLLAVLLAAPQGGAPASPAFRPPVAERDAPRLLEATRFVRELEEPALRKLVPRKSGLFYIGCPNCDQGRQERQLTWSPDRPDEVACEFCKHRYPSQKYPMDQKVTVHNPRGEVQHYPYWANEKGYRHFFEAKRDDLVKEYLAARARDLSLLYNATGDEAHARRAAVILDEFARVFPGWCYHYDYPFQQKIIDDGDVPPAKYRRGYRTARWNWWAYSDIPNELVQTYDWIKSSGVLNELSQEAGVDVAKRIETDLIRNAAEQVLANRESYSNMDPTAWNALILTSKVIGEPQYIHTVVKRLRELTESQFFYDGFWHEGAPSYGAQTVGGLGNVINLLNDYSDPEGYQNPDGERFDHLDLEKELPLLARAREALSRMRLPNGRLVPVHDTWRTDRSRGTSRGRRRGRGPSTTNQPNQANAAQAQAFLLPALGHAALGGGTNEGQTQIHLTWSGGYGHSHGDNLSLLLFSQGQEMLSDLGYTHTKYRAWTLASAAHNTVVIDGRNQTLGGRESPSDGSLRFFDTTDPRFQVVSAEGTRGYPGLAKTYQRTLLMIDAGQNRHYAVDLFEVEGGRVHDYFLHGDADADTAIKTDLELSPLKTLLPDGMRWEPTKNEGETGRVMTPNYAYGFLKNLAQSSPLEAGPLRLRFLPEGDTKAGLHVTLLPETGSRLIVGQNPSTGRAGEDDALLDKFSRPFALVRHESKGTSRFAAVLEPHAGQPFLSAVERIDAPGAHLAVRVRIGDRTDLIVMGAKEPIDIEQGKQSIRFQGMAGVLSLNGDRAESAYAIGDGEWKVGGESYLRTAPPQSLALRSMDNDVFVLESTSDRLPSPGEIIRVVTADGWVYPHTVVSAEPAGDSTLIRVREGSSLSHDAKLKRLQLLQFPGRLHHGPVRLEWTPRANR